MRPSPLLHCPPQPPTTHTPHYTAPLNASTRNCRSGSAGATKKCPGTLTPTVNQSPTATASTFGGGVASPATPFADGLLGFSNAPTTTAATPYSTAAASYILPAAILGGALLVALALRK